MKSPFSTEQWKRWRVPILVIAAGIGLGIFAYFTAQSDAAKRLEEERLEDSIIPRGRNPLLPKDEFDSSSTNGNLSLSQLAAQDSLTAITWQNGVKLLAKDSFDTGYGTKSVVIDKAQRFLYSMNLETKCVYQFAIQPDASLRLASKLDFVPTKAEGFDYRKGTKSKSFAEKPVEGCLTHNDRFLWVSLHNAGGVVVWDLKRESNAKNLKISSQDSLKYKPGVLTTLDKDDRVTARDSVWLPLFKTGKTPKVIAALEGKGLSPKLFVANWHSDNVSILDIAGNDPSKWHKIKDLPTGHIPRGMTLSHDEKTLFVAQMGGSSLTKVSMDSLAISGAISTPVNPRHVVERGNMLYVSINQGCRVIKYDALTGEKMAEAKTLPSPRTIVLSPDGALLFVTCYQSNALQVFRAKDLSLLGSYPSTARPVTVDVTQHGDTVTAYTGNYTTARIKQFTFVPATTVHESPSAKL